MTSPSSALTSTSASASGTFALGGEITVPRLGFGAMQLPGRWTRVVERDTAVAVARRAVDLGVRFIDTAAFYFSPRARANDILREALHPYPADLTIATKIGPLRDADGEMYAEATAGQIRELVEENLGQLGVDRLDLVSLRVGRLGAVGGVSIGERFEALAALREEGLVRHLGLSNVSAEQLAEAHAIAPVAAVQNRFGVLGQEDAALVDRCAADGIAYMPFFALGGGHSALDGEGLRTVAERYGATEHQIALAWGLARSPSVVQIPGTASQAHLEQNVAAARLVLDEEDMALLTV
ncbi:oxidoreductase [Streptomyces cucumeris]|uniref:oxidoreductase n=1 Tax=Streptomyces cucumeris TaxID=2962890 RepID=UPI003D746F02